jgi:Ser/Thr protein kinase RdoA (MazF antagonist)
VELIPTPDLPEEKLVGGNVTPDIVRVGNTVRRPAGAWTASVHAFLTHLADVGYEHSPRSYGLDEKGRHVLEYVDGEPGAFEIAAPAADCTAVGRMIRDLHDAAESFRPPVDAIWNVVIPPPGADLVVHHDLAPWNTAWDSRARQGKFFDFDNAGPGTRIWDLAYAAHGFARLSPASTPEQAAAKLAALADGYRLDDAGRGELIDTIHARILSMFELLRHGGEVGNEPWGRLWVKGEGVVWKANADFFATHYATLRDRVVNAA